MRKQISALLISVALLLSACGKEGIESEIKADTVADAGDAAQIESIGEGGQAEGEAGPYLGFSSLSLDGEKVDGGIIAENKLTMVNIWGTRCPYCIYEMPDLAKLQADYADRGFAVLGIVSNVASLDGETIEPANLDMAREIVKATGADYPHIVLTESVYSLFVADTTALPTTIFVDGNGNRVGKVFLGARSYDEWAEIIEDLLGEVE